VDRRGEIRTASTPEGAAVGANADSLAVTRNALTGYVAWAVNLGVGFVLTPVLLRSLGVEGFGAWTIAFTIASYVGMVELGLGVATVRHIASALADGDWIGASAVAASARATYLAMGCAGVFLLSVLVMLPGRVVETHGVDSSQVRIAVLLLGLGLVLSSVGSVYPAIAIGAGRADLGTTVGTAARLVMAAAQAVVVLLTGSLVALAAVTAFGVVGGTLAVREVTRRHFSEIDVRLENASRDMVRRLLSSGWRNTGIAIAASVAIQSDVLVVGVMVGTTAVAAYGIAVRASTMIHVLATRATDVLVPTFAHDAAVKDTRRIVTAFRESVFLTRAILVPALIVLVAFGDQLLRLWLGNVPSSANDVLVILLTGAIVAAPGHSAFALLTGMNRLTFALVWASITAVVNLSLSILLAWRFGVVGPALGSLVGFLILDMVVLPRYVGSLLGIPWLPLSFAGLRSLAVPALASSAVAWAATVSLGQTSPREGLVAAAVTGLVYLAVLWATLNSERRGRYGRLLAGATRRRSHNVRDQ
jgi:O-antigen/teichoic acid export membrane protein